MIKNILWDFDGVILDSMKIKGDGFVELLKDYEICKVRELEKFHYQNGGVSRFKKIKYFFNDILNISISEEEILKLADSFAKIVEKNLYNKNNLIEDSVEFIKLNYQNYSFHIVSGAEHNELNNLCKYFGLDKYFKSIHGSPTCKEILVKNVLEENNYNANETVLIGDSINDYESAKKNHVIFYGYNNLSLKSYYYINSFRSIHF